MLNLRVEAVMTVYGLDLVLRLFNFDESMLNLDLLSIFKERAQANRMKSFLIARDVVDGWSYWFRKIHDVI